MLKVAAWALSFWYQTYLISQQHVNKHANGILAGNKLNPFKYS